MSNKLSPEKVQEIISTARAYAITNHKKSNPVINLIGDAYEIAARVEAEKAADLLAAKDAELQAKEEEIARLKEGLNSAYKFISRGANLHSMRERIELEDKIKSILK